MPKPKPLTAARVAELCVQVTQARLRALSGSNGEHTPEGHLWMVIGLENALTNLVGDLAGPRGVEALHEALGRDISATEVAAYKAERAARQQAYLDRALATALAPTKAAA